MLCAYHMLTNEETAMMGDIDKNTVQGWSVVERGWKTSEREYAEVSGVHGTETVGSYHTYSETRYPSLYLDPKTGLVVHDVFAYEAWLKTVEARVEEAREN